eukprot:scaffold31987_cov18-Tisochrysis_lutea.AAC.2
MQDTFFLAFTTFDDFEDFPLQSSALRLEGVENPTNFEAYFGSEAFRAFSNIRGLDVSPPLYFPVHVNKASLLPSLNFCLLKLQSEP